MPLCLLGLGSNLGDRGRLLDEALVRLQRPPEISVAQRSRYHETRPVGGPPAQPAYLNAVAVLDTSLSPQALLFELQTTENGLGRQREELWGPRTIDLDLLLYDEVLLAEPELIIPHPRMGWRRFVLEPAAEVAAEMRHPGIGWTIAQLLMHLNSTPWYMAIAGPIGVGKTAVAGEVAEKTNGRLMAEQFDSARLDVFYHDPSSHAWQIELEFLKQRALQLAAGDSAWARQETADRRRLLVRTIAGLRQRLALCRAMDDLPGPLGGGTTNSCEAAVDCVASRPIGDTAGAGSIAAGARARNCSGSTSWRESSGLWNLDCLRRKDPSFAWTPWTRRLRLPSWRLPSRRCGK